jgi:hypothetical protein
MRGIRRQQLKDAKYLLMYIGLKNLVLDLVLALQNLPAARLLPSPNGRGILLGDLSRFISLVVSNELDIKSVIPLLNKVVDKAPDADIWDVVYGLVTESTPPRPLPYPNQTPISFNTGSLANTSEYRKHFDGALKDELDSSLHIDIPNFFDTFFGELMNLESVAGAVFKKCKEDENPLYKEGEGGGCHVTACRRAASGAPARTARAVTCGPCQARAMSVRCYSVYM